MLERREWIQEKMSKFHENLDFALLFADFIAIERVF